MLKAMKNFARGSLAVAVCALLGGGSAASEWHPIARSEASDNAVAFQLNPGHSGSITLSTGFAMPLKKMWTKSIGAVDDYFLIADGLVFVTGIANSAPELYAFDVQTGKKVWSKATGAVGLAYDNGNVFAQSGGGLVTALDHTKGKQRWQVQLPFGGEFFTYPTAADGSIYISGDPGGYLYSVSETDGAITWALQGLDEANTPTYGNKGVYFADPCQYFMFKAETGKLKWHDDESCHGGGALTPALFNKRVYINDIDKGNFVFDAKTGRLLDTFPGVGNPTLFSSAKGGDMGVIHSSGGITCWKLSTGQIAWNFAGDGHLSTAPIAVNGLVVVGSSLGMLYVLDSKDGKVLWSANTGLVLLDGLVAGQGILVVSGRETSGVGTIEAFAPQ